MKNKWIVPASTLVVGALGGFISGHNSSPAEPVETAEARANVTRKTRASGHDDNADSPHGSQQGSRRARDASRLVGVTNRFQSLLDQYGNLAAGQFEDEAAKLEHLPFQERMMASTLLFSRWAEVDPAAAMAFAGNMGFAGGFARSTVLQSWASVDPASAARYYAANPREFAGMGMGGRGPMGGQSGAGIIAGEWARQDPEAAMAWANSLTTDKGQAMNGVVAEVAKTDPAKAAGMLTKLGGGEELGGAYSAVAQAYGASNFNEAQTWIRSLPEDEQARALSAAIRGLSDRDPEAAAKQVGQLADGNAKNRAVAEIVDDLSKTNLQAAADFIKQQENEDAQRNGMRQLMPNWVAQNPSEALNYANSLQGEVRDSALQSYVWSNQKSQPAEVIKVAETIANEQQRSRAVMMAASRWMREDEAGAKQYIEQTSSLSDEAKQRVLEGGGMFGGRGGRGGRGQRGAN